MYDAAADPYCYRGSTVLKNRLGLRRQEDLDAFEAVSTTQRADEPLPGGSLDIRHLQAVHRHLFQDVYTWAGRFRTVRMGKEGSAFCYPEHINREIRLLFGDLAADDHFRVLSLTDFAVQGAQFMATLNAIHPFREGNGRTQTIFMALLAARAGHPFDFDKFEPSDFLAAMVASFKGDIQPLEQQLRLLATE